MVHADDILDSLKTDDAWVVAGEARLDAQAGQRTTTTPNWMLAVTHAGRGEIRAGQATIEVTSRELVLVRPGAAASTWSAGSSDAWHVGWFHFRPRVEWVAWLDEWPTIAPGHAGLCLDASSPEARAVVARLDEARELSLGRHARRAALAVNAVEQALLWCDAMRTTPPPPDDRMLAVADWMCRNLDRPVTLDGLAVLSGLSVSGLSHRFRAEIGLSPLQYLEQRRMRRARELLALTGQSVREVAASVGFENAGYFAARFRKANACSPDDYRRQFAATTAVD